MKPGDARIIFDALNEARHVLDMTRKYLVPDSYMPGLIDLAQAKIQEAFVALDATPREAGFKNAWRRLFRR